MLDAHVILKVMLPLTLKKFVLNMLSKWKKINVQQMNSDELPTKGTDE